MVEQDPLKVQGCSELPPRLRLEREHYPARIWLDCSKEPRRPVIAGDFRFPFACFQGVLTWRYIRSPPLFYPHRRRLPSRSTTEPWACSRTPCSRPLTCCCTSKEQSPLGLTRTPADKGSGGFPIPRRSGPWGRGTWKGPDAGISLPLFPSNRS